MENRYPLLAAHYVNRADHFLQAMNLLVDDLQAYGSSVGLLAVHSAISLNDAVIAGATGTRRKREDHMTAADDLQRICSNIKLADTQGLSHLRWLLSKKTLIAYSNQRVSETDLKLAVTKARRFSDWAYRNFKEMLRDQEAE
jgi:hypothetical protein